MNYPIWDLPAAGLLIAAVAILHVFISHFAVGGGLFLVVTERRARRAGDQAMVGDLRRFSRFFVLLTLVLGAITGVGIWFTIGLVNPQGTSALIQTFVWAWAIEWTLFFAEIVAAMVYYYGWDRLSPATHQRVGWVYFWNAWLSLVVIDGILAFMLTPGEWVVTRRFWDGFANPTYISSLVARTLGAVGLAGLYALAVAGWSRDAGMKQRFSRYAGLGWVLPMALATPVALFWYLAAAAGAGVPVGEILGTSGNGPLALLQAIASGSASGQPITQRAALVTLAGSIAIVGLVIAVATVSRRTFGRPTAALLIVAGLATVGGAEWAREGLRKPYVIGRYLFVNGVRLPAPAGAPATPAAFVEAFGEDPFTVEALSQSGVIAASRWTRRPDGDTSSPVGASIARGAEVFGLLCRSCHTLDGYLAVRPLVAGKSPSALSGILERLARPVGATGQAVPWNDPSLRLATWRGRQMPPFTGTAAERGDLANYLASVGGMPAESLSAPAGPERANVGQRVFEGSCSACHAPDGEWPMAERVKGRDAAALYDLLGRLPALNEMMPAFDGTDAERRALSEYLASVGGGKGVSR